MYGKEKGHTVARSAPSCWMRDKRTPCDRGGFSALNSSLASSCLHSHVTKLTSPRFKARSKAASYL